MGAFTCKSIYNVFVTKSHTWLYFNPRHYIMFWVNFQPRKNTSNDDLKTWWGLVEIMYSCHAWFFETFKGWVHDLFTMRSKTKKILKLSNIIGWEQYFGSKDSTLWFRSKIWKRWSGVGATTTSCQILVIPTQEKYSWEFEQFHVE